MVLILECSLEYDMSMWSGIGNLICCRHLFTFTAVKITKIYIQGELKKVGLAAFWPILVIIFSIRQGYQYY